jgi:23S rRNA G2445 N2-methylase RlmL
MSTPVLITCAKGIPPILRREVEALGLKVLREDAAAVEVEATFAEATRLCLHLRTAHRVLWPLSRARVTGPNGLFGAVIRFPWEKHLDPGGYLRVHGFVRTQAIRDERFAFLTVKDAVMDRMRDRCGRRPDSGPDDGGANLYLHWIDDEAKLYFDLAGQPLSKRGYRRQGGVAPMQEALAAAILLAGDYTGDAPLVNPMCGSGTLAIEAALIARRQAPGLLRDNFGFLHLLDTDPRAWQKEVFAARTAVRPAADMPVIRATDHDPNTLRLAKANAERAGVADLIQFEQADYRETSIPDGSAWVVLNPEYGVRMGDEENLEEHYREIGQWFKSLNTGGKGLIITGNISLSKRFGLKLSGKHTLYNGAIECRLLEFDLFPPPPKPA